MKRSRLELLTATQARRRQAWHIFYRYRLRNGLGYDKLVQRRFKAEKHTLANCLIEATAKKELLRMFRLDDLNQRTSK